MKLGVMMCFFTTLVQHTQASEFHARGAKLIALNCLGWAHFIMKNYCMSNGFRLVFIYLEKPRLASLVSFGFRFRMMGFETVSVSQIAFETQA